uniref:Uncharacterized protein n=1 Tax=Arundo donax TaxID=35708 RepID=A0A0A8YVJ5_ARUDO
MNVAISVIQLFFFTGHSTFLGQNL